MVIFNQAERMSSMMQLLHELTELVGTPGFEEEVVQCITYKDSVASFVEIE